jgi:hypothetical protein
VTEIPILVEAIPREKNDGILIVPDDYDTPVRVLPLDAPEMLGDSARALNLEREYNVVPQRERAGLMALLRLTQAIQTRKYSHLDAYARLQTEVEIQRWLDHEKELRAALGQRNWKLPDRAKIDEEKIRSKMRLDRRIRYPLSEASKELNRRLRHVRFVIWWSKCERKLVPGLYCEDMTTALAAVLFSRIASSKGLTVCVRCGKRFVRIRKNQTHCSLRCGNAARKARQRAGQ